MVPGNSDDGTNPDGNGAGTAGESHDEHPAISPAPSPDQTALFDSSAPDGRRVPKPNAPPDAPSRSLLRRVLGAAATFLIAVLVGGMAVGACLAALVPGATMIAQGYQYTAPSLRGSLSELSQRTNIYASDGAKIGVVGLEDREPVTLDQVPQMVIDAVVATEDATFYENSGIDVTSVFRALAANISAGGIEQGGSTITQQLVKNRVYRANRALDRKVRELVFAYRLNEAYSKDEILEEYLNTVYFGRGAYGIASAAERYFAVPEPFFGSVRGKSLDELTLPEAALLAGLISSPGANDPFEVPERALEARASSLDRMAEMGVVTRDEAKFAAASPLPVVPPPPELRPRSYFVEEVQRRLLNDPRLGDTERDRRARLLRGGLEVHTTLDQFAQFRAQLTVNESIPGTPPFTAAMVSVDPQSGAVRSMVAGPGFEEFQYNIVTHRPGRQVGSTWKIITLTAALEAGYSPNDLVDGTSPCIVQRPGYGIYPTANAEPNSGGRMTLRDATTGSVNCAYARVLASMTPPVAVDMAKRLGIQQDVPPYLSITLGTIEATPLEMATVGATIAAGGVRYDPYFVQTVTATDGTTIIDESSRAGLQVIEPNVAACAINILRGVVTGGTGTRAALPGRDVAGKTGTTDDKADAWFVGFTPQLSTAVWYGATSGNVPGAGFGGEIPATIWGRFVGEQLAGQPAPGFKAPDPLRCELVPPKLITELGRTDLPRFPGAPPPVFGIPAPAPSPFPVPAPSPLPVPAPSPLPVPAPQ